MSSATLEQPTKVSGDLAKLCKFLNDRSLGGEEIPLKDLPKELAHRTLLAHAVASGLVEVGRQSYSQTIIDAWQRKGKDGKVEYDENKRQIVDKEVKCVPESTWSWLNLETSRGRKPIQQVLAEDDELAQSDDTPRLHLRLTTKGFASTGA